MTKFNNQAVVIKYIDLYHYDFLIGNNFPKFMCLSFLKKLRNLLNLFVLVSCFYITQPSTALEGGQSANSLIYTGTVILSYGSVGDGFSLFNNCAGIVLEPRKILTAASCVQYYDINNNGANTLIPANQIFAHPVQNGKINTGILGVVTQANSPNSVVSSYVIHPQNSFRNGPYNLAILTLTSNIGMTPAYIYNGSNTFINQSSTALGWKKETRPGMHIPTNYLVLNQLQLWLVNGDTNINSLCYDSFNYTGTVFCGGLRNGINFLDGQDEGASIFRNINGQQTVIGVLSNASHGILFDGIYHYEKYARISSMVNFIEQYAPNTQFWNENSITPESPSSIVSILQLLLLGK